MFDDSINGSVYEEEEMVEGSCNFTSPIIILISDEVDNAGKHMEQLDGEKLATPDMGHHALPIRYDHDAGECREECSGCH